MLFGNINKGIEDYKASPDALLIDVREPDEYAAGILKRMGYQDVRSIGGISRYKGDIEAS